MLFGDGTLDGETACRKCHGFGKVNGPIGLSVLTRRDYEAAFNLMGGAPATYPSIFKGCHWGQCTANSGLPIQVSNLGSAV